MLSLDSLFTFCKQGFIIIFILFLIFAIYMYFNQNNIIYVPEINGFVLPEDNPVPYQNPSQLKIPYKEVEIITKDKLRLYGWLTHQESTPCRTMIYFHENAGSKFIFNIYLDVGFRLPFLRFVHEKLNMNVLIIGYRGYGKSQGKPSEEGLKLDGEAVATWAFSDDPTAKAFIDQKNVFLFGRSLGGAVAAHVAYKCKLPFKGVIIENTFSSMGSLVDSLYPMLKYIKDYLLKNKWETNKIINQIEYPMLYCRSEKDELIPKSQMDDLYNNSTKAKFKRYYVIKNGTHNEGFIYDTIGYQKAIEDFIDECNTNTVDDNSTETKKDK